LKYQVIKLLQFNFDGQVESKKSVMSI